MNKKIAILPKLYDAGGDASKKWYVYFSVRDPKSDKMVRFKKSSGLEPDIAVAERHKKATELIDEYTKRLQSGWNPFTNDKEVIYEDGIGYKLATSQYKKARAMNNTFAYLASEYIGVVARGLSGPTQETYRSKLREFRNWLDYNMIGDNDITSIDNTLLTKFFVFLIDERKLSGNTVKKYTYILKRFWDWAIKEKKCKINPVFGMPTTARVIDKAPVPIQKDDLDLIRKTISTEDPQLWLAMQFQYYCALRPGNELRLLRIVDINFETATIRISDVTAKKKVKRLVSIPRPFMKVLKEEYKLHRYEKWQYVFGKNGMPGADPLGKNNMRYRFNRFRKMLGLPEEYKYYSMKHTGASMLWQQPGVSLHDIMSHLGHTRASSTEHYVNTKLGKKDDSIRERFPEI